MRVVLAVRKKPRHGETRLGGADDTALSAAVRRHRGGPAVVTSHNGRYLAGVLVASCGLWG